MNEYLTIKVYRIGNGVVIDSKAGKDFWISDHDPKKAAAAKAAIFSQSASSNEEQTELLLRLANGIKGLMEAYN